MLEGLRRQRPPLALGVLLHDVGKPGTFRIADRIRFDGHVELGERIAREILNRLRFSNAEIEQVIALIANHMRFSHVHQMRESTLEAHAAHCIDSTSTWNCTAWIARQAMGISTTTNSQRRNSSSPRPRN